MDLLILVRNLRGSFFWTLDIIFYVLKLCITSICSTIGKPKTQHFALRVSVTPLRCYIDSNSTQPSAMYVLLSTALGQACVVDFCQQ